MANRRPQGNRRMDFVRNDRGPKNFGRSGVSPWQGGGPGGGMPNLLPLSGGSTEATLALASNIINLLQPRPNPVPSLLDMPIRREFGPNMGRYDRPFGPNRMGNQGNFRRTGNYNRAGERINTNRKPFRPHEGQRQQNKSPQKKDADSKAKNVKESEEEKTQGENEAGKQEEKKDKECPKTRYDDINPQLLKCHICNKSMWDGRSFENHLSGRAHAIMMQKTAESYALTADTMRQEFKIREMKRTRKTGQQPPRDFYCAMCDLYAADGAIHRTTVGHRKLKKYLHPTCTSCHKEMPTRIELDEHRLTAEHLKNMQDKSDVVLKPKPEVMVISTLNMEQMYLRDDRQRWRSDRDHKKGAAKPAAGETKEGEAEDKAVTEGTTEDKTEETDQAGSKHPLDKESTVLDYKEGDDLSNVTPDMLPVYSTERGVGRSFLSEFRCVQCTLCRKLLDGEETAEVHLRTWRHHQLFSRLLADKTGNNPPAEANNGKRVHNPDDEGNWKRRKTGQDGSEDRNGHDEDDQDDHDDHADAGAKDGTNKELDEPDVEMRELEGEDGGDCPEDELEDWEQSVDEILNAERSEDPPANNVTEEKPKEVAPVQEEPVKIKTEAPVKIKTEIVDLEVDVPMRPSPRPTPAPAAPIAPVTPRPSPAPVAPVTPRPSPAPATPIAQVTPRPTAAPATPVAPVTPTTPAPVTPATPKPKNTPRGRGRGRRRY